MGSPTERTVQAVQRFWRESANPGLTFQQAKLYSQHIRLTLKQPGLRTFGKDDVDERLHEAELLLSSAFLERSRVANGDWRRAAKRAGEILEWLGHAEGAEADAPIALLASAAYQLAGYPALARGVLSQTGESQGAAQQLQHLLDGNFSALLIGAHTTLLEMVRADGDESVDERINRATIAEAVRCLSVIAAFMRWGDEPRLPAAIAKLSAIASLARHSQVAYSSLTARLCSLVAAEYEHANVWTHLRDLLSGTSARSGAALNRWCRRAFLTSRSLVWASQAVGIKRISATESFVLCTPTGSGKTTIAQLALLSDLLSDEVDSNLDGNGASSGPLALYLVPSRALASEVESRLDTDFARMGGERIAVTGLYGGTDWGPTDAWLTSSSPTVLVCTYEKAEALLRFLGPIFMRRVRTVIVDEAHSVNFDGNADGLKTFDNRQLRLEILAVRLMQALEGSRHRLIALSAVTAGIENSLTQWLVGDVESSPARSDYRSTRQLIGQLECWPKGTSRISYDLLDRQSLAFSGEEGTPYVPNPFPPHPSAPSCERGGPLVRLRPYLAWAAMHLAQAAEGGNGHSVLISITSNINAYAVSFLELIEVDWKDHELPSFFVAPTGGPEAGLWTECLDTAKDYFTEASPEYRLLRLGIAVHHGKMPALLARRLKGIIEAGIVRIVLATSTLSEGVNLPVEYILIPEVHRNAKLLTRQEFLNLVGRAGRPGYGTEGRALVLVPCPAPTWNERRLRDAYRELLTQVTLGTGADAASPASSPLGKLIGLVREEWEKITRSKSDQAFLAWLEIAQGVDAKASDAGTPAFPSLDALDAVLIAAVEEIQMLRDGVELSKEALEDSLRLVWSKTLAKITAIEEGRLAETFLKRGAAIPNLYPDSEQRRRIYKTSLPPLSARQLLGRQELIRSHLQIGTDFALQTPDERYEFIERIVDLFSSIPRFAPGTKVGRAKADWKAVLKWWLDPKRAPKVPKPEQVSAWHDYAYKNFTYKVNWALGSVLSLCLDDVEAESAPVALSLQDWPESGLPWSAFWLKELLTWGTLEPVAAFLLARGRAVTRAEGERLATGYYQSKVGVEANALLDPRSIRDWAEPTGERRSRPAAPQALAEIPATLRKPGREYAFKMIRVLPAASSNGQMVEWFDVAGYQVATSARRLLDAKWSAASTDFVLDVDLRRVVVTPYL